MNHMLGMRIWSRYARVVGKTMGHGRKTVIQNIRSSSFAATASLRHNIFELKQKFVVSWTRFNEENTISAQKLILSCCPHVYQRPPQKRQREIEISTDNPLIVHVFL